MKSTNVSVIGLTPKQVYSKFIRAIKKLEQSELPDVVMNGKTIRELILNGVDVDYNDGYFVIEVDSFFLYVDVTTRYERECM